MIPALLPYLLLLGQYAPSGPVFPTGGGGSPAVTTTCYQGSSAYTHTILNVNDSGANAIFVVVASFNAATGGNGAVSVSHNPGSSVLLTPITPYSSGNSPSIQWFHIESPTTSATDTFVITNSGVGGDPGLYDSECILAISGITGTYSSVANNNLTAGTTCDGTSCQTGSVSPSGANQVVMAANSVYTPTGTPTIDSSFVGIQYQAGVGGTAFGIAAAYKIQTTGAAVNPTFTWTNSASTPGGVIAAVH